MSPNIQKGGRLRVASEPPFPHLRVGTFIEASVKHVFWHIRKGDFPTFGWGLSLRPNRHVKLKPLTRSYFPTFGWGLSLRLHHRVTGDSAGTLYFPTFGWGLSLRPQSADVMARKRAAFPHLRVGTFIEAFSARVEAWDTLISPPSGGDFH